MNEDFSEILNKFSNILKEKNIDLNRLVGENLISPTNCDIKNIINNCADKNTEKKEDSFCESSTKDNSDFNNLDFNLDIETILKIKNIIDKINKSNNNPRNTLLSALKPYLKNNKKEKLEQYIKIANLLSVLEGIDSNIKPKFSENNYDFILILTLFLLIF